MALPSMSLRRCARPDTGRTHPRDDIGDGLPPGIMPGGYSS
ncbi:Uncharacterized protein ToN1_27060 [Aromatoleum petrolei]|nr:Uncharacterized protein ToN1_27060 [Aromatoleum petrolei]